MSKVKIAELKFHMARNCVNVPELAKISGIPAITLRQTLYEKTNPRLATIGRIAKALNVSVDEIAIF